MISLKGFDFPSMDKITNKIWIGNEAAANNMKLLKSNKITHILQVGREFNPHFPDEFLYMQIPIDDRVDQNISNYFEKSFEFINAADSILVHCAAGVSRSSSIVIAYLMKENKLSYIKALTFVKNKRSLALPNSGFAKQLKKYEEIIC